MEKWKTLLAFIFSREAFYVTNEMRSMVRVMNPEKQLQHRHVIATSKVKIF